MLNKYIDQSLFSSLLVSATKAAIKVRNVEMGDVEFSERWAEMSSSPFSCAPTSNN